MCHKSWMAKDESQLIETSTNTKRNYAPILLHVVSRIIQNLCIHLCIQYLVYKLHTYVSRINSCYHVFHRDIITREYFSYYL